MVVDIVNSRFGPDQGRGWRRSGAEERRTASISGGVARGLFCVPAVASDAAPARITARFCFRVLGPAFLRRQRGCNSEDLFWFHEVESTLGCTALRRTALYILDGGNLREKNKLARDTEGTCECFPPLTQRANFSPFNSSLSIFNDILCSNSNP